MGCQNRSTVWGDIFAELQRYNYVDAFSRQCYVPFWHHSVLLLRIILSRVPRRLDSKVQASAACYAAKETYNGQVTCGCHNRLVSSNCNIFVLPPASYKHRCCRVLLSLRQCALPHKQHRKCQSTAWSARHIARSRNLYLTGIITYPN